MGVAGIIVITTDTIFLNKRHISVCRIKYQIIKIIDATKNITKGEHDLKGKRSLT